MQKTNIDDTLDVFPCHGVGGMSGMLLTGILLTKQLILPIRLAMVFYFGETNLFLYT